MPRYVASQHRPYTQHKVIRTGNTYSSEVDIVKVSRNIGGSIDAA